MCSFVIAKRNVFTTTTSKMETLYVQNVWLLTNYNENSDGFLMERTLTLSDDTKIILSLYQHGYTTSSAAFGQEAIPCKNIDYFIYIWEDDNKRVQEFSGAKRMKYYSYLTPLSKQTTATVLLKNTFAEHPRFSRYILPLKLVVTEPKDIVCASRFIFG